jgi:ABC-2 type transport system permease protein
MKKIWLIAQREIKERIGGKSFLLLSILGPLLMLVAIYFLFIFGGKKQQKWEVLIVDPAQLMENKIMSHPDPLITYHFYNNYLELEEFISAKKFKKFDAFLELNEKILSNKLAFVFYKEKPNFTTSTKIQFQFERRLEEIMIKNFSSIDIKRFREIKQPIDLKFKNVYDPREETDSLAGYAGLFFGFLIFFFIFLYGSTVMRSVALDKSNRVVEVILSSARPNQFLAGKILGIGIVALLQFALWFLIIGIGLYFYRTYLFPDLYDPSTILNMQITKEISTQLQIQNATAEVYNDFVTLIFERLSYTNMLFYFLLFFIGGYVFYASLFAALGALGGSESDGQQYNFILIFILLFSLYAGYESTQNPNSTFSSVCFYLPFTSPIVALVKLSLGFSSSEAFTLFISLFILFFSTLISLWCASRWFKNGILNFGHRLKFSHFLIWFKK